MNHRRIYRFLILPVLALAPSAFAKTYYVGACHANSYATISAAVAAAPAGATIEVCPGTYAEQIVLTQAVTLEGISSNGSDQAMVVSPPNGLVVNATDDMGDLIAAQVVADPISGFTISNLTFDASNNEVSQDAYVVGILVQNSSGTIKDVVTRYQTGGDGGIGIWIQGGQPNPVVTVENSSIHDFDYIGIWTQAGTGTGGLTSTLKNNFVNGDTASGIIGVLDVEVGDGATNTVTSNTLVGGETGISVSGGAGGTISKNNLINNGVAIAIGADGNTGGSISVTSNYIWQARSEGIVVYSGLPEVQKNTIAGTPTAIDFFCNGDSNMKLNTILDANVGDFNVPVGFMTGDSYSDVAAINESCSGPAARPRR